MSFLFLTSSLLGGFSQFNGHSENLDRFFDKLEEGFAEEGLMQSDGILLEPWDSFEIEIPESKSCADLYDPLDSETEKHEKICELEKKLSDIAEKIGELQPLKSSLKEDIEDLSKKGRKCDDICKFNLKQYRRQYKDYKDWMRDYQTEKRKLSSELAKYYER